MITEAQRQRRSYMVKLMTDVKGVHYTLGWLGSNFQSPYGCEEANQRIVESTIKDLEQEAVETALKKEAS